MNTNKKVIFIGNACTGKSKMVCYLTNAEYYSYSATFGAEVDPYVSPNGNKYNIWDCAGNQKYGGLKEGYYLGADIAIIFTGGDENNNTPDCGDKSPMYYENLVRDTAPYALIFHVHNPSIDQIKQILN